MLHQAVPDPAAAVAALAAADPDMAALIAHLGPPTLQRRRVPGGHFAALARSILYQQLAGRAAATIHGRFVAACGGTVTAEAVAAVPDEALRAAGLSNAKARAIRDLSDRVVAGRLKLASIGRLPDDEVVARLIEVRGIGRWTAEMFLLFTLGRPDVWPTGDFAVAKGYALIHDLPEMPSPRALEALGDPYRPFRSYAAWYCWRATDTVVPEAVSAGDEEW